MFREKLLEFHSKRSNYYALGAVIIIATTIMIGSKKKSHSHEHFGNSFCCSINCMDGRPQKAVYEYMRKHFGVEYVDVVTEAGPNRILATGRDKAIIEDIKNRVGISVLVHHAKVIAISAHDGCAGNPAPKEEQIQNLREAKKAIESFGFNVKVIMLYVPEGWEQAELIE